MNYTEIPDMPPITVHTEGVIKLLSDIKPYKLSGPESIPATLLKELAITSQLAPPLILVFQASLNQQKLPSDWKTAHVVPVF